MIEVKQENKPENKQRKQALPKGHKNLSQSGITLLETIVVIVIGALIIAGAVALIQRGFSGSNIAKETQNINLIMTEVRSIRSAAGYGAPNTDLVPLMVSLNIAPPSLVNGNALMNSWNGSVKVNSTGTSFAITYEKVPKEDCAKIVTNLSQAGTFESINVGGTEKKGPVAIADAHTACAADENTVIFTPRR